MVEPPPPGRASRLSDPIISDLWTDLVAIGDVVAKADFGLRQRAEDPVEAGDSKATSLADASPALTTCA